ncbi:3-deoxy-manno-octulosonate cytidylyltransferase [Fluoribacter gormanii]|uniref:3-deoxy-manno-octulosonate cytidylyltransferase n=1 Tax=Fluoribacter gormanii TaxID=464 RepID=A0A377GND8_9GAMM|nr:3-deoxy-manno-octulosonate cytidylyltransferase [Fluoribacter gormanii]KTD04703.1 3-deoxy-manno-octulosonate cytidylyltransferase [Fluoribacter gormanii]MCW8470544.1 3-deoxy-manno-octulosonate cytidylyltransferase [Fluoribacter gormanii]SIR13536.1 3-deoxy-manno-octulosonate cytidylyltransferase (CMP-KDO synthetase) [Fluoribacter gormanii]STO26298.1 3-deoxy-manno-octulosonate cytidylyltransferase [Fluoribacter gormanii]
MHTAIVIPARYASTRLPGKPLAMIQGQTMLQRVVRLSCAAAEGLENVSVVVATDHERIVQHCNELGVASVLTSPEAPSGTDRVAQAIRSMAKQPDFILNMQGDAPLTPPDFLRALIDAFAMSPCDAVTPVTQLTWNQLDDLRQNKLITPFSGTTAVFDEQTGKAFWFSKNIIPAIRKEKELRQKSDKSPVFRHIGLYGYSREMLEQYISLPESTFEKMEGLEQLRILENGYTLRCIPVDYKGRANMSGIDSPEDVVRAEALIAQHGELLERI